MSFLSFNERPVLSTIICAFTTTALIGSIGYYTGNWLAAVISVLSVVLVILVVVMVSAVFSKEKKSRLEHGLEDEEQQVAQSESQIPGGTSAEVAARFSEAIKEMRRTLGGRASIYELPWYLVIGPKGSGKSGAVREFQSLRSNSKLRHLAF